MANINLLPWREELRRRKNKNFGVLSVVAVLATLGVIVAIETGTGQHILLIRVRMSPGDGGVEVGADFAASDGKQAAGKLER